MSASVLISYATRYGSTQEVAEAIASTVRDGGFEVELLPMQRVQTLDGYRAIVLGAPIYIGQWHKEAHNFLTRHQEALIRKPTAVFALGPLGTDENELRASRAQLDNELTKYPWLTPAAIKMFVGKYDPAKLGIAHRLIAALPASPLHNQPASDLRDWTAIRAWAGNLSAQLQLAMD